MAIVLTGDRPTGNLHLGHYIGSLKTRVEMQNKHEIFILIADVQALTDNFANPMNVKNNVASVLEDYLACGLDPNLCCIFVQSGVPALFELATYYMNLVSLSRLQRNPTVKTELRQKNFAKDITCGFLLYPISQAADITAFRGELIPVGMDQLPLLEQTNEIVRSFNRTYNTNVLKECNAVLSETPKLLGIDGAAKASKSLNNCIFLTDTTETVRAKVHAMYTDPNHIRVTDPGRVKGNVVFHYLDIFYENTEHLKELKRNYQKGGLGDSTLKKLLGDALEQTLEPIRERRAKINKNDLTNILHNGANKAREVAAKTLSEVKTAMGIIF